MTLTISRILILPLLALSLYGQKVEVADGTKIPFGTAIYSGEAEAVANKVKNSGLGVPKAVGTACTENDRFRINDSAEGFYTSPERKSTAYLYSDCNKTGDQKIQGIIVILKETAAAHYVYQEIADVKVSRISDLDGNGLDELAIFSHEKTAKGYRTAVRIVEFSTGDLKRLGSFALQSESDILTASKIYVEPGGPPKFYEARFSTDGSKWKAIESLRPVDLNADKTNYIQDKRKGILKHLSAWTFFLQMIGFLGLLGFVIYDLIVSAKDSDEERAEKTERKIGKLPPIIADRLPKLQPINCANCGAGVPLREAEMVCPSCGTKSATPESYFDVARTRKEVNEKIRQAAAYIRKARFLVSNWARYATLLFAIWLVVTLIAVLILFNNGNLEPYQTYFSSKAFFALGSVSNCFWVVSLLFGFAIWSPDLKKAIPTIELDENLGQAENTNCSQCGGAIQYLSNDLATVCGYCGVETYRAKLAWKLRNLTNDANHKASFSLLEAKRTVEDAIWELTGTPRTFAFLLILVMIFGSCFWVLTTFYDSLPSAIKDIFEFVGDIIGAI